MSGKDTLAVGQTQNGQTAEVRGQTTATKNWYLSDIQQMM